MSRKYKIIYQDLFNDQSQTLPLCKFQDLVIIKQSKPGTDLATLIAEEAENELPLQYSELKRWTKTWLETICDLTSRPIYLWKNPDSLSRLQFIYKQYSKQDIADQGLQDDVSYEMRRCIALLQKADRLEEESWFARIPQNFYETSSHAQMFLPNIAALNKWAFQMEHILSEPKKSQFFVYGTLYFLQNQADEFGALEQRVQKSRGNPNWKADDMKKFFGAQFQNIITYRCSFLPVYNICVQMFEKDRDKNEFIRLLADFWIYFDESLETRP